MQPYFDLGHYSRKISTRLPQTQLWFDRGLNWLYGFNQEESVECFKKAVAADPKCAIAYWGIAYASGPFYNMTWEDFSEREEIEMLTFCNGNLKKALENINTASVSEGKLIKALTKRFQNINPQSLDIYSGWDDDYANAMRDVYQEFPQDLDVAALFAEAMMTRTPWKLWNLHTGEAPAGTDTLEVIEVLEKAISQIDNQSLPSHPAILHLHIHALEMSTIPERAMKSADDLRDIQPDAGHLHHMSAHIYGLCGRYEDALRVSEKAIIADRKYLSYAGIFHFYTTAMCHDLHMKMHAAMMCGLYQSAIDAATEMTHLITDELLSVDRPYQSMTLEGYYSMRIHVLVRFGRWQEIIDEPDIENIMMYCVTNAMTHYAKGIAYSALGRISEAQESLKNFEAACLQLPETRYFFNNDALNILAVGKQMLKGELNYHQGNHEHAFDHLRQAVILNDNLNYSEPWPWMHPPRHALGALLMAQGQFEEAESVYRADLGLDQVSIRAGQHLGNVWSLHGFHESLLKLGKQSEAQDILPSLDHALSITDVNITASCCCRLN